MKKLLPTLFTAAVALLPAVTSYATLDPKMVSADARWLVHVDLNQLRESDIGRELLALVAKNHPPKADSPVSLDFQKVLATVGRATAYGANFAHDPALVDGTLVVEGTDDLRKIAEGYIAQTMVSTPEKITELKDLPFEAYSIGGDLFVGFPQEPIIILSKLKPQLARAHELYRGSGASMAKAASSPLRDLVPTSRENFLVAASVVPGETMGDDGGPQTRLIKLAQSASLSLGEKDQQTFAAIKLNASSTDTADKLQKIVQGLTAMASLAHSEDKDLEQFMKSVVVDRQDLAVLLKMSYPSQRLAAMVSTMQQKEQQKHQDAPPTTAGKTVAEWRADQDLGSNQPSEKIFAVRAIKKVALVPGAIIRISGKPEAGEHARLDYVEIATAAGNSPALKFEAEYMKLSHYEVEKVSVASGGKVIKAQGQSGVAELQFPGVAGDYDLSVHYLDENDGKSAFTVRVEEPGVGEAR